MRRIVTTPRPDWRQTAEQHGFDFHSPSGTPYWDESACYSFTMAEIEQGLEAPAEELEQMCLALVDEAVRSDAILARLQIPRDHWDFIAASWRAKDRNLYGRMDFAFDGKGPAKLYEYNADTPTSLYESAVFQWVWLEQMRDNNALPRHADQFNSMHERLIEAFRNFGVAGMLHLASVAGSSEDLGTISYLEDCATQAGLATAKLAMSDIGVAADGRFTDGEDRVITTLFKLYPWEWMLREAFAANLHRSGCMFIEPVWKSVLSNKGLLPLLWERHPRHPNLLPSFFEGDPRAGELPSRYVRKPIYSREGANVQILERGRMLPVAANAGTYGQEGHVLQAYHPLPDFGANRPMCGVWLVASQAAAMGIREDAGDITTDGARFLPHMIVG